MSTTISRHPDDANLMSFAAGGLAEPLAAAIAGHVALCPRCRNEMRLLEALGGALLSEAKPADHTGHVQAHSGELAGTAEARERPLAAIDTGGLAQPIAAKYDIDLDSVPWRWLGPGIWYHALALSPGVAGDLRLLKIAPGRRMPEHGHGGAELTLVLEGAFSDASGKFGPGDIQDVDGDVEHQPLVDPQAGCICLVASEQPARFKGLFSRLLQPWTGM